MPSAIPEQLRKPRTISPSMVSYLSSALSLQPYQFQTSALGFVCPEPELPGSRWQKFVAFERQLSPVFQVRRAEGKSWKGL